MPHISKALIYENPSRIHCPRNIHHPRSVRGQQAQVLFHQQRLLQPNWNLHRLLFVQVLRPLREGRRFLLCLPWQQRANPGKA